MLALAHLYDRPMGRWEPDARGRLAFAAMELYLDRGFEQTTVAEIAERAGLTERTFFRHFADKKEVIFAGQDEFKAMFVDIIGSAPAATSPLDAVALGLHNAAILFEPRRPWSLERQRVINANPALQERELIKLAGTSAAIAETLRARGVDEPAASLTAQSGMAIFHVAFQAWIDATNQRSFTDLIDESLVALRGVAAAT